MAPQAAADGTVKEGPASHARRDLLLGIQAAAQKKWEAQKVFQVDAPAPDEPDPHGKFFGNFPYPYMNGVLHLGHAFSISKLEFAAAYHRLCGKRVLFPQGFHCTGMPIKACADKLDAELQKYGVPPKFPSAAEVEAAEAAAAAAAGEAQPEEVKDPSKFVAKKGKAAAKAGAETTQWGILAQSDIPPSDIPNFRTPDHWLRYFPPLAKEHLTILGCGVDWRRSFITTDRNPFYDSFVRWQFWTLYRLGKVVKDKRNTIYSPLDGQPCADHDRSSGEGVNPQEYTLVKMEVLELTGKLAALRDHGSVFLLAATLRPETMAGQTNCWALPEGKYGAYRGLNNEIYVVTERAALNMAYQEKLAQHGKPECLLELTGQDLMGTPLRAPNAVHERIYVLPLLTILTNKGTGIVTSVPSDSPDDYMALLDLKKKPKLREKFGVQDDWVMPFEVVPIIDIPGFGNKAAQVVCEELKIQSQNDTAKLTEAKKSVYLKGFSEGVMEVGKHAGRKVSEVKGIMRDEMLAAGEGLAYSEPEKPVVSRSGDDCVVALTDQWYLTYGEEEWQALTKRALEGLETYSDDARNNFNHILSWLKWWACSRSFGLGTRVPWDEQFLIESLSDSTIYMAYYCVAHLLQGSDMYGQTQGRVRPEDMTNEVWDHIFLGKPAPANAAVPADLLASMRQEFEYWYPFDLRVSGKDLIGNHLTMSLYNHTAIWSEQPGKWPRAMRCNGHLMLNSEKMSKSKGNFKTLKQSVEEFSADATRWALADAGDGMDDANFETSTANAAILRITKELVFVEESLAPQSGLREGEATPTLALYDRSFANAINIGIARSKEAYDRLMFREVMKAAAYDLNNARDAYRFACGPEGMNKQLVRRYIEVSAKLLAPIVPHTSEHIWSVLLKQPGSVINSGWPAGEEPDFILQRAAQYIEDLLPALRKTIAKAEVPPKKKGAGPPPPLLKVVHGSIFVAERFVGWQEATLLALQRLFDKEAKAFPADYCSQVVEALKGHESVAEKNDKEIKAMVLPFTKTKAEEATKGGVQVLDVRLPFDERQLLINYLPYLKRSLGIASLDVHLATDSQAVAAAGVPSSINVAAAFPASPVTHLRTEAVA